MNKKKELEKLYYDYLGKRKKTKLYWYKIIASTFILITPLIIFILTQFVFKQKAEELMIECYKCIIDKLIKFFSLKEEYTNDVQIIIKIILEFFIYIIPTTVVAILFIMFDEQETEDIFSFYIYLKENNKNIENILEDIDNKNSSIIKVMNKGTKKILDDGIIQMLIRIFKLLTFMLVFLFGIEELNTEKIKSIIDKLINLQKNWKVFFIIGLLWIVIIEGGKNILNINFRREKMYNKRIRWIANYEKLNSYLSKILEYDLNNKKFKYKDSISVELIEVPGIIICNKNNKRSIIITTSIEYLKLFMFLKEKEEKDKINEKIDWETIIENYKKFEKSDEDKFKDINYSYTNKEIAIEIKI
ncbi:hypothetical protein [Leptotrichia trevisanii]|uniref:hypothetical protein n=1 Tax=Leptotrichia trevisanii TaxID=109328 RepID=UPI0026F32C2A|nr:hypothetical protein [Leptotrichia trevisanii]